MLLDQYTIISESVELSSSGADNQLAQGFKIQRDVPIGRVYLYLTILGAPGGYLQAKIYSDSSGPSSQITNGASDPVLCSDIDTGWVAFDFNMDARPEVSDAAQMYIVLASAGGYAADATNYIALHGDQTVPHYVDGSGYTYNVSWAGVSTATDFAFKIYSGRQQYVYSNIRDVEHISAPMTQNTDSRRFNFDSTPSIEAVLDHEESVARKIDSWLAGAGIDTPLTADADIDIVQGNANYCVALECEMMHRTAGFWTKEGSTRAAALRKMCNDLHDDLKNNGIIYSALKNEQDDSPISGSDALTAGQIDSDDRDDRAADSEIIQPAFSANQWDN